MTYRLVPCDIGTCRRMHGVVSTRRPKPAPYTGPFVRAQRSAPDTALSGALEPIRGASTRRRSEPPSGAPA